MDDGGVGVVSLLGGLMHFLLAPLPLAPSFESVGDVLALLMYSFVQVLALSMLVNSVVFLW